MARILVVDDEPHIVKLVSFTLEKCGHEVLVATDGMEAISLAREHTPDLILLDVMMPLMTGFEAATRLKSDPKTEGIPIAFLSAKSQVYERQAGLECGAEVYLCKPFTPRELADQVSALLGAEETGG